MPFADIIYKYVDSFRESMQNLELPRSTGIRLDRFMAWTDLMGGNAPIIWIISWLGSPELARSALNNAARALIVRVQGDPALAMSVEKVCLQIQTNCLSLCLRSPAVCLLAHRCVG